LRNLARWIWFERALHILYSSSKGETMTNEEYQERLEYHIERAKEKEYDALTVETKVLEKAYELLLSRQYSD